MDVRAIDDLEVMPRTSPVQVRGKPANQAQRTGLNVLSDLRTENGVLSETLHGTPHREMLLYRLVATWKARL